MKRKVKAKKAAPKFKSTRISLSSDQVIQAVYQYLLKHGLTTFGEGYSWALAWDTKRTDPSVEVTVNTPVKP